MKVKDKRIKCRFTTPSSSERYGAAGIKATQDTNMSRTFEPNCLLDYVINREGHTSVQCCGCFCLIKTLQHGSFFTLYFQKLALRQPTVPTCNGYKTSMHLVIHISIQIIIESDGTTQLNESLFNFSAKSRSFQTIYSSVRFQHRKKKPKSISTSVWQN